MTTKIIDKPQLTEEQIREYFAETGKFTARDMMACLKSRYAGQYNVDLAKRNAKEMAAQIKKVLKGQY